MRVTGEALETLDVLGQTWVHRRTHSHRRKVGNGVSQRDRGDACAPEPDRQRQALQRAGSALVTASGCCVTLQQQQLQCILLHPTIKVLEEVCHKERGGDLRQEDGCGGDTHTEDAKTHL